MSHQRALYLPVIAAAITSMVGCSSWSLRPVSALPVREFDVSRLGDGLAGADTMHPWYAPDTRKWRHIVIHHSATDAGSAEAFDRAHRGRGWDELGYHFVIDNGRGGPDGRVEVGGRWRKQKHGAHCGRTRGNEFNEHGIGICVVGDFSSVLPSEAQLRSLRSLILYLMRTRGIAAANII
ncbi:MAG: N-acetylmuramoyl-L-alanine amidase, partial [Planctomycetes bacterium]|nr:N-acetylmuramoyl-L-alanine amidase [Planctomycetota bacterium]